MFREALITQITKDILKSNNFKTILNQAQIYEPLLENTIKNFYECKQESYGVLFRYISLLDSLEVTYSNDNDFNELQEECFDDILSIYGVDMRALKGLN